ncbi:MAG TPA: DUF1285 domain-containing protein [Rhodobacter sp.]|jgi:uncharacterized protein|nr:DUF1285 domain-containing protein [Paracoccaceae bacterium]HCM99112.1 DUF1285 domain-containing protein [Rhodobacter sp.]
MIVKPPFENVLTLAQKTQKGAHKGPAPVHLWNPPFCGDIDMRIAQDGTWFYQGSPIGRAGMVKLFSSILKREDNKFFLVTPVEKVGITVEDAPFIAIDLHVTGACQNQELTFETHVGDRVTASAAHQIRISYDPTTKEPRPYVMVRAGLEARIDRKTYYRMAEKGQIVAHQGQDWFGIWSSGQFFALCLEKEFEA